MTSEPHACRGCQGAIEERCPVHEPDAGGCRGPAPQRMRLLGTVGIEDGHDEALRRVYTPTAFTSMVADVYLTGVQVIASLANVPKSLARSTHGTPPAAGASTCTAAAPLSPRVPGRHYIVDTNQPERRPSLKTTSTSPRSPTCSPQHDITRRLIVEPGGIDDAHLRINRAHGAELRQAVHGQGHGARAPTQGIEIARIAFDEGLGDRASTMSLVNRRGLSATPTMLLDVCSSTPRRGGPSSSPLSRNRLRHRAHVAGRHAAGHADGGALRPHRAHAARRPRHGRRTGSGPRPTSTCAWVPSSIEGLCSPCSISAHAPAPRASSTACPSAPAARSPTPTTPTPQPAWGACSASPPRWTAASTFRAAARPAS